jgi:hypothetical protein
MLRGKRILVAEDNDWIAAELVQTITDYRGIALGPAQTNIGALALIDGHLDGAILHGNLLDGPITPVARALWEKSVPLVVFTGLGLPSDLQRSHPDIPVILKPSPLRLHSRHRRAHPGVPSSENPRRKHARNGSNTSAVPRDRALSDDRISRIEYPARTTLPDTQIGVSGQLKQLRLHQSACRLRAGRTGPASPPEPASVSSISATASSAK